MIEYMIRYNDETYEELKNILNNGEITTVYQPIVSFKDASILGYEALSRGRKGSYLESPDVLFSLAKKLNKTSELELICGKRAIERAETMEDDKLLFINIDPNTIKDIKIEEGFTTEFLDKHNLKHKNIIFEITEKTAITDYNEFNQLLNKYRSQGYKLAIDDIGAGYSGLRSLTEIKPNYVKIDMELIRDIHTDTFKQVLIEALVKLGKSTGIKLIAEGIECKEELERLIELGVYAGQGYFICRPNEGLSDIDSKVEDLIISYNIRKNMLKNKAFIGQVEGFNLTFDMNTKCSEVSDYLKENMIPAACVLEEDKPVGLIMKHIIDSKLATKYGVAVFYNRPISLIMDREAIIVDYYTDVEEVSELVMRRSNDRTYDCIMVTKDNEFHSLVTVKSLLEFITMIKFNYAKKLNPLTGLPGNVAIHEEFNLLKKSKIICCILYLDLDNFKIYNDTYGFKNGDRVIQMTANIIKEEADKFFKERKFIGHIGGDDYICILYSSMEKCEIFCESLINKFDKEIMKFLEKDHVENGFIIGQDRQGEIKKHSLVALSIAGLCGEFSNYKDMESLAKDMAGIKKRAKNMKGSCFIIEKA